MFMAALFVIAKRGKPPRCPLTDKWINKTWYILRVVFNFKKEGNFETAKR